jgi:hypothetical protein
MLRKHKLLLLIPAVLLMTIFIGMIPLNMTHKLAGECPLVHGEQASWINPCPFRSVVSNGEPQTATLNSVPLDQALQPAQALPTPVFDSFFYPTAFNPVPLRC